MAFGANDILTVATGRNFIREITGMSEQAYYWWNLGLNIASTVFAIAGSIGQAKGVFCFAAGTGVLAIGANGVVEKTAIEDIKVGDRVLSYNEATGMTEIKTVTQVFTSTHSEVINIGQSNGQVVTSSLGHPYYTQRGWISAENLRAGDILQAVNGETVIVEFVQHELLESPQTLYNFEVDGNHNYYVAESVDNNVSDFILGHNKGCKEIGGIKDGTVMTEDEILDAAKEFLGPGYKEVSPGRFVSNGGLGDRQVRMLDVDLASINNHAGAPHFNFEIIKPKYISIHVFFK